MLRNLKISKMTRNVGFFCSQFLLRLCSIILLKYHQSTRERLADFINRGLMILFEEYWTVITYKKGIFRKLWKKGLKNIIHSNKYKLNQLYLSLHLNLLFLYLPFPFIPFTQIPFHRFVFRVCHLPSMELQSWEILNRNRPNIQWNYHPYGLHVSTSRPEGRNL